MQYNGYIEGNDGHEVMVSVNRNKIYKLLNNQEKKPLFCEA